MSTDWIPFALMSAGKRNMVRWIHPGKQPLFLEPFFNQSISALIGSNAVQKLTPIDELLDVPPVTSPSGFIFHVSRCGSTLVSRSLAAVPRHRVIAEPAPLNQLLLAPYQDQHEKARLLKGLMHALCGTAENTACIFKFTSWNLLFLAQIRALFPVTPWLFIYREPADVVQSLMGRPPGWATDQTLAQRLGKPQGAGREHMILMLKTLFEAPLAHMTPLARACNYAQLPQALPDITRHFGLTLDPVEQEAVARIGQFDAKQVGEIKFHARVQAPLPAGLDEALAPLYALYQQWEQIRNGSVPVHAR